MTLWYDEQEDLYEVQLFDHVEVEIEGFVVAAQITKVLPGKRAVRIRFRDPLTDRRRAETVPIDARLRLDRRDG